MTRQRTTYLRGMCAGFAGLAALSLSAPALAQAEQTDSAEKYNMIMVYGDDPCPASTDDEITVCARLDEGERFRIPKDLRGNPNAPQNQAWAERVKSLETVGAAGFNSCSPTGADGITGCTTELIDQAYAEKAQSSSIRYGRLIEEAREERLSTIDAEAAETQSRVEALEAEIEARERAKAEAAEQAEMDAEGELPTP